MTLAVVAASVWLSSPAHAGYKTTVPVHVDSVNRWAEGTIGSARNSSDIVQYIGCYVTADLDLNTSVLRCTASDAAGQTASCVYNPPSGYVTGPNAGLPLIAGNSYLSFGWDASGNCTDVYVEAFSFYEPKKP